MKEQSHAAEYSHRMSCDNCGKRLQYATYDYKCRHCGGNIIGPIGRAFLKAIIQSDNGKKKGGFKMNNETKHGWYSKKMAEVSGVVFYYSDINNKRVTVTAITQSPTDHQTNWDDMKYVGEVKEYLGRKTMNEAQVKKIFASTGLLKWEKPHDAWTILKADAFGKNSFYRIRTGYHGYECVTIEGHHIGRTRKTIHGAKLEAENHRLRLVTNELKKTVTTLYYQEILARWP